MKTFGFITADLDSRTLLVVNGLAQPNSKSAGAVANPDANLDKRMVTELRCEQRRHEESRGKEKLLFSRAVSF